MLPRLLVQRKTGQETFHCAGQELSITVLDFWQWAESDFASNALRGRLAEFLVARALGLDGSTRAEWDPYDLELASGFKIEVKSSGYLQTWAQKEESVICFDIRPTLAWSADTNDMAPEIHRRRQADLYIFALLQHRDKATLDPLDVAQWLFYLVPTRILDERLPTQKQLRLPGLLALSPVRCTFAELAGEIRGAESRNIATRALG